MEPRKSYRLHMNILVQQSRPRKEANPFIHLLPRIIVFESTMGCKRCRFGVARTWNRRTLEGFVRNMSEILEDKLSVFTRAFFSEGLQECGIVSGQRRDGLFSREVLVYPSKK